MANNYVLFAAAIDFPPEAKEQVEAIVALHLAKHKIDEDSDEDSDEDDPLCGITIDVYDENVAFYTEEYGSVDAVCVVAQEILDTLKIDEPFILQWAETCSRPRIGEFGGGAAIVRRGRPVAFMATNTWVDTELKKG